LRKKDENRLPKNYTKDLYVYTSQIIFDRCNIEEEYKILNESGRNKYNISLDNLKLNMALMINFLTTTITDHSLTNVPRGDLIHVTNGKIYRICIDILKKNKVLFVCSKNGRETYRVGHFTKGYKFNVSCFKLEYDTPLQIKVSDHRIIKKVLQFVDILQVSEHLKELFGKYKSMVDPHRSNVFVKKPKTLKQTFTNDRIIRKCVTACVYMYNEVIKKEEKRKTTYLCHLLSIKTAFRINKRYLYRFSYTDINKLINNMIRMWDKLGSASIYQYMDMINERLVVPIIERSTRT
jgi:hypothetical protein